VTVTLLEWMMSPGSTVPTAKLPGTATVTALGFVQ
jgi:hypothetical protein